MLRGASLAITPRSWLVEEGLVSTTALGETGAWSIQDAHGGMHIRRCLGCFASCPAPAPRLPSWHGAALDKSASSAAAGTASPRADMSTPGEVIQRSEHLGKTVR